MPRNTSQKWSSATTTSLEIPTLRSIPPSSNIHTNKGLGNLYYCCAVRDSSSIRTEATHLVSRLRCCYLPDVLIMYPCDVVGTHRVCSSRVSGLHFRQPIVAEAYELIMDSDYSRSL